LLKDVTFPKLSCQKIVVLISNELKGLSKAEWLITNWNRTSIFPGRLSALRSSWNCNWISTTESIRPLRLR